MASRFTDHGIRLVRNRFSKPELPVTYPSRKPGIAYLFVMECNNSTFGYSAASADEKKRAQREIFVRLVYNKANLRIMFNQSTYILFINHCSRRIIGIAKP